MRRLTPRWDGWFWVFSALAGILCFSTAASAEPFDHHRPFSQYVLKNWQLEQGLPQNSASAVVRDLSGFLWFGTEEGLVRFDGIQFEVFDRSNTPELSSHEISSLAVDQDDRLWIGTTNGLVVRENGSFRLFGKKDGLFDPRVVALLAAKNGDIWISTLFGGVYRLRHGRFKAFGLRDGMPTLAVGALVGDDKGRVFVGCATGIVRLFEDHAEQVYPAPGKSPIPVFGLVLDARGDLVFQAGEKVLRLVGGESGKEEWLPPPPPGILLDVMYAGPSGAIWAGGSNGLARYSGGRWERADPQFGYPRGGIAGFFEDEEGDFWIGTRMEGLLRLSSGPFLPFSSRNFFDDQNPMVFFEGKNGTVWIGTEGGSIFRFQDGRIEPFPDLKSPAGTAVRLVVEDEGGALWATNGQEWLARYAQGRTTVFPLNMIGLHSVTTLFPRRGGEVWLGSVGDRFLGSFNGGLYRPRLSQGDQYRFPSTLLEDSEGTVWIGVSPHGLMRWKDGVLTAFGPEAGFPDKMFVESLLKDRDGNLWIGTMGQGLVRFRDGRAGRIGKAQGLPDDNAFGVAEDAQGRIWINSNHGVFCVDKKEVEEVLAGRCSRVHCVAYGAADGLPSREALGAPLPPLITMRDGRLLALTVNGVAVGDPRALGKRSPGFHTVLTGVVAGHERLHPWQPAVLNPGVRDLEFHYAGLFLKDPAKVNFRYQLEGFDSEWIEAGSRRQAFYTNLPPGDYRFRVAARILDGPWNEGGTPFRVHLKPFFYQTGAFQFFLVFAGFFLVGLVFYLWQHRLLRDKRLLEQGVQERTALIVEQKNQLRITNTELEYAIQASDAANQAKSQFLAAMSHEIRTPMNGIIGMTELALQTELTLEQREYLELVRHSAKSLLSLLNDILDLSKIEAGKVDLLPEPFEINLKFEETLKTLGFRAAAKGVEVVWRVDPELPSRLIGDPVRLRQVLVNLVGNAVKFTEQGEIEIRIERARETPGLPAPSNNQIDLVFHVRDSGIGIPLEKQQQIFEAFTQADSFTTRSHGGTGLGLTISRRLVELMGGRIWLESRPGVGSTFSFAVRLDIPADQPVPRPETDFGNLAGCSTLVVISNRALRERVAEILTRAGFRVETAEDQPAAEHRLAAAGAGFALIVVDDVAGGNPLFHLFGQLPAGRDAAGLLIHFPGKPPTGGGVPLPGKAASLVKPVSAPDLLRAIAGLARVSPPAEKASDVEKDETECARGLMVLVVEDHPINRKLIVRLMEKAGHQVTVAENGRVALQLFERHPFDLILMDVQMPEMDGVETSRRIRSRELRDGGHVPILAMTAHAMVGDREECLAAGMDGYVSKPIQPEALFSAIDNLVRLKGPASS